MRSARSQRARCVTVAALWAVGLTPACARKPPPPEAEASEGPNTFTIPAPRGPRRELTADEVALVYPDVERLNRDPFLTMTEEAQYDGRNEKDMLPPPTAAEAAKLRRGKSKKIAPPKGIASLKHDVRGIIIGRRNTFAFKGKLYEEGDTIAGTDWIVTSIQESGIKMKSKDNKQNDFLGFNRTAATIGTDFTLSVHGQ